MKSKHEDFILRGKATWACALAPSVHYTTVNYSPLPESRASKLKELSSGCVLWFYSEPGHGRLRAGLLGGLGAQGRASEDRRRGIQGDTHSDVFGFHRVQQTRARLWAGWISYVQNYLNSANSYRSSGDLKYVLIQRRCLYLKGASYANLCTSHDLCTKTFHRRHNFKSGTVPVWNSRMFKFETNSNILDSKHIPGIRSQLEADHS